MKYLIFFLLIIGLTLNANEYSEEIIFQEKSFSQNNIISTIKSKETLLKLINSTENNNNFFYSLFDPLTNNMIYPIYSNENDFFFEKINMFSDKDYRYQFNSNLFEKVIFEKFQNSNNNESYLAYLYDSNQFDELCRYLFVLDDNQKKFDNVLVYNILCLIKDNQFEQINFIIEIFDQTEFDILDTKFLLDFLSKNTIVSKHNLSELGLIDKYIALNSDTINVNVDEINNILELEIYLKSNTIDLYQINYLFKNRVVNKSQYLSMLEMLKVKPKELVMYEEMQKQINYNKKLEILESYISLLQLDLYDVSRLINEQFSGMRITSRNLNYINGLMLLSLYENSSFLENLLILLKEVPNGLIENNDIAIALKNYLIKNFDNKHYADNYEHINSPLMKFLFLNRNINFIESEDLKKTETDTISVNPVYLASLAENLNLIDSYIYYVNLSEKFYMINEFDLYFLNNYIIDNEFLNNELIKLAFRTHLINL
tara:strand:+ start:183 stop:1640 length:1458 start_codon:yes stop_codon:yes gene_type:complete